MQLCLRGGHKTFLHFIKGSTIQRFKGLLCKKIESQHKIVYGTGHIEEVFRFILLKRSGIKPTVTSLLKKRNISKQQIKKIVGISNNNKHCSAMFLTIKQGKVEKIQCWQNVQLLEFGTCEAHVANTVTTLALTAVNKQKIFYVP